MVKKYYTIKIPKVTVNNVIRGIFFGFKIPAGILLVFSSVPAGFIVGIANGVNYLIQVPFRVMSEIMDSVGDSFEGAVDIARKWWDWKK